MKNPFKRNKKTASEPQPAIDPIIPEEPQVVPEPEPPMEEQAPDDGFIEWSRSRVHGGIERRERNDIYEAYNVYGTDSEGNLVCRRYHRYPEHERDFGLSYSRILSFGDFNRRLLAELDQSGLTLTDYHACIAHAQRILTPDAADPDAYRGFSEEEEAALRGFCDNADILTEQSYLHSEGVLSCACTSAVGGDRLMIRFRKPLPYDALDADIPGVSREDVGGYDIDNLWIMGVYNRLRECCTAVTVTRLTSAWSIEKESLWLCRCAGFGGVAGDLLAAVGEADSFRRFGFWSLEFSKK